MAYIARRFGVSLFIIYVVITISFFLIRLMPGNAVDFLYFQLLASHTVSPQQALQQVQSLYGVNMKEPLLLQYVQYIWNMIHGSLGNSILYPGTSVLHILMNALPWTILIVSTSLIISFFIGISIGTLIAYFRKSKFAVLVSTIMTVLSAIPNYIVAIILLYLLADIHHIFPTGGAYSPEVAPGWNIPFLFSVARHAALPVIVFIITQVGGWSLGMKSSVVSALGEEYITSAHSHGIGSRRIIQSYVGRNAILPLVTSLGLSIGFMVGGSVFIETLFNYPGIGFFLITAVNGRDYPLMMGAFIIVTSAVVLANFLTDLINQRLDPRTMQK